MLYCYNRNIVESGGRHHHTNTNSFYVKDYFWRSGKEVGTLQLLQKPISFFTTYLSILYQWKSKSQKFNILPYSIINLLIYFTFLLPTVQYYIFPSLLGKVFISVVGIFLRYQICIKSCYK